MATLTAIPGYRLVRLHLDLRRCMVFLCADIIISTSLPCVFHHLILAGKRGSIQGSGWDILDTPFGVAKGDGGRLCFGDCKKP